MHCPVITHPEGLKDLKNGWVMKNPFFFELGANGNGSRDSPGVVALATGRRISGVNDTWKSSSSSLAPEELSLPSVGRRSAPSNEHHMGCAHHHLLLLLLQGSGKAFKQHIFVISHQKQTNKKKKDTEAAGAKTQSTAAAFKVHPRLSGKWGMRPTN